MKIDTARANKRRRSTVDVDVVHDEVSTLKQLILLTEQYKRLNELLENKRNLLRWRVTNVRKRQHKQKKHIQNLWEILIKTGINDSKSELQDECGEVLVKNESKFLFF